MSDLKSATTSELLDMLGNANREVIIGAAQELASRDEKSTGQLLRDILRSSSDAVVRNAVAIVLSDLKDPQTFKVLVDLLNDDRTQKNRGTLLYALGAYDCSPVLPLLVKLVIEGNFEVSRQALSLISEIETEVDEDTWNICTEQLRAALTAASQERHPLLAELLSYFEEEQ